MLLGAAARLGVDLGLEWQSAFHGRTKVIRCRGSSLVPGCFIPSPSPRFIGVCFHSLQHSCWKVFEQAVNRVFSTGRGGNCHVLLVPGPWLVSPRRENGPWVLLDEIRYVPICINSVEFPYLNTPVMSTGCHGICLASKTIVKCCCGLLRGPCVPPQKWLHFCASFKWLQSNAIPFNLKGETTCVRKADRIWPIALTIS